MSYTYTSFQAALQLTASVAAGDADFANIIDSAIDYAEQRIYRELDLLATVAHDTSTSLTAYQRQVALPTDITFITVQGVSLRLPSVPGDTLNLQRCPLTAVSRDVMDAVYGSQVPLGQPVWFAMIDNANMIVGPCPDQDYALEYVGTIRPPALYTLGANGTTFLTTYLPDLFLAAAMIFVAGYQKNFGSQADDPRAAMSWETQYQTLKASAETEEARRKFQSTGWTSLSAPSQATPTR